MSNDDLVEVTNYPDREAWLEARKTGIGASESPALFGLLPKSRASAFSLWAEKTGRAPAAALEGDYLLWGTLLEGPIADEYSRRTGRTLWTAGQHAIVRHPKIPCMFATPDRWIITAPDRKGHGRGVCQVKNTSSFMDRYWDEGPPDYIEAQVQHELACTGFRWGSIPVLIGGNEFQHHDVERNDIYIEELEQKCVEFWALVERGEPPAVDGSDATKEAIKRMHPLDNLSTIELDRELAQAWDDLQLAKLTKKCAEEREKELVAAIKLAIGDASFARLPDGRQLSCKHQNNSGYTSVVQPYTMRVLREVKEAKETKSYSRLKARRSKKGEQAA